MVLGTAGMLKKWRQILFQFYTDTEIELTVGLQKREGFDVECSKQNSSLRGSVMGFVVILK